MQFLYLLVAGVLGTTLPLHRGRAGSCFLYAAVLIIFAGCIADLLILILARGDQMTMNCGDLLLIYFIAHLLYCWYALCRERQKWELINRMAQECRKAASWGSDQRPLVEVMADIQVTMRKKGYHVSEKHVRRALYLANHPLVQMRSLRR